MTMRLYYDDSMLRSFDANVVGCDTNRGRFEVVLDRTAFYPTSGGQPFDVGTLGAARVNDVFDRDDGTIVHVVSEEFSVGQRVRGEIDWLRRFDHMQQHTGQHILSAAFDRLHGARTESFHLGADTSTIDLAREMTPTEIAAAEDAACRVVWEDRGVVVRFADAEEAAQLPLRKEPTRTGPLRLIEVEGFDLSACGGTHVPRTGMIGVIAIVGWERFKGASRVTFVCGARALRSHAALRDTTTAASRLLSVASVELPAAIERLQSDLRQATKAVEQLREDVTKSRAEQLRAQAETIQGLRVVLRREPEAAPAALKALAAALVAEAGTLTVLVGGGQPLSVVVARSTDVPFDAGAWMRRVTSALGGRGGGRPELAQGGVPATADDILGFARKTLAEGVVVNIRRSDGS